MISIRHLRKEYTEAVPLKDINAEIDCGEAVTIIGPSGTGKSTLLRCINGLETPTSGEILIDGVDVLRPTQEAVQARRRMGMVFQSFNLFPHLTVLENIVLGPMELCGVPKGKAVSRALELLEAVGLADRADRMPEVLSGGQKQRVAIARTLAMNPEIVLFDEPTSALDPTMVGEVMAVLRSLAEKKLTMLIVTHEMRVARDVSSRILYLDQGVVYEDGTPDQIFNHPAKERTRAFIKRMKHWEITVDQPKFDFISAANSLDLFARSLYRPASVCRNLRLLFEELVLATVLPQLSGDFSLKVNTEISEADGSVVMRLEWAGTELNPLQNGDALSLKLLRGITDSLTHRFENGANTVEAVLHI